MMTTSTAPAPMSLCSNLLVVQDEPGRGWILTLLVDQASTGMRCGSRCRSLLAGSMLCGWVRGEGLGIPSPHHGCLSLSLYLAVTCSLLLPEECVRRFSWVITSGIFPFSALFG